MKFGDRACLMKFGDRAVLDKCGQHTGLEIQGGGDIQHIALRALIEYMMYNLVKPTGWRSRGLSRIPVLADAIELPFFQNNRFNVSYPATSACSSGLGGMFISFQVSRPDSVEKPAMILKALSSFHASIAMPSRTGPSVIPMP